MARPRVIFFTWLAFVLTANAAEHRVSSSSDLARVREGLRPGDTIVLTDGDWVNQALVLSGHSSAEKPITYRAETPGKVVLSEKSSVLIEGEHVIVSGIILNDCSG